MTSKQILAQLLLELGNITNTPISKKQAIDENKYFYLALDNYPMYGGYHLVKVNVNTGDHYTALDYFYSTENRLKASEMIIKLRSFIAGINYAKSL